MRKAVTGTLPYLKPFDWQSLAEFLGARATIGVELVADDVYASTVQVDGCVGWVTARNRADEALISVEISSTLEPVADRVMDVTRHLFDLAADPSAVAERLGELAATRPGLRVPGALDGFGLAVRAILGQQVSVRGATTLAGRFAGRFGEPIETPIPHLNRLTPAPAHVAASSDAEIAEIGIPMARARCIRLLATEVASGRLRLDQVADIEMTMATLKEVPGIGEWTAQYVAMRALGCKDAFPHTDLALLKALGGVSARQALVAAEKWRPYRSYAVMHLWAGLSG